MYRQFAHLVVLAPETVSGKGLQMPLFSSNLREMGDGFAESMMKADQPTRHRWETVLQHMHASRPDLLLHLGDPFDVHGKLIRCSSWQSPKLRTTRVPPWIHFATTDP